MTAVPQNLVNVSASAYRILTSCPLSLIDLQVKGLEQEALVIKHIQVNQAPRQRRRTYRAHGRINPYMSSPCHIEIILAEENEGVKREVEAKKPKLNARQLAARARRA